MRDGVRAANARIYRKTTMDTIPNKSLRLEDIPWPVDHRYPLDSFALTFNGYKECGSFEECARIANDAQPTTLTELRACLFFEQRRWRHFGVGPDEDAITYMWSLVERIRAKVMANDLA